MHTGELVQATAKTTPTRRTRRAGLASLALLTAGVLVPRVLDQMPRAAAQPGSAPSVRGSAEGLTRLDPRLRHAVQVAIAAAAADGVTLRVTSGWRSAAEQRALFDAAIRDRGSVTAAERWVLPPERSAHVRGEAVDVGPRAGARWLELHGEHFGLCRRYDNEYWHFELLAPALGSHCPQRQPHA